jgi:hypothetical protein
MNQYVIYDFVTNSVNYYYFCCCLKACSFQWILMLLVLALHSYLTFLLPVPGCPSGYLGPGGLQNKGQYRNCTGGSARYIDIKIFGREHIYQHPTAKIIYDTTEPFDPEGFLGEHYSVPKKCKSLGPFLTTCNCIFIVFFRLPYCNFFGFSWMPMRLHFTLIF